MTKDQAEVKIKAAAYAVAAELGEKAAIELLQAVAAEISGMSWRGPGNR